MKIAARSILEAVKAFNDMDGQGPAVHTVIPSGADTKSRAQGLSIRAPEIWKGVAPTPACDVWSVGVTLAHFLAAGPLFGIVDKTSRIQSVPLETSQAAWAIGKIIQIIGPIKRDENPRYKEEFDYAEGLVEMGIINMGPLEEELSKTGAPKDCIEFIKYLLTLDHEQRPTAAQALQHPWLNIHD
ncbi:hypothetical protein LOZ12_002615 [Ophidiomyces ophidiicola]|uniref:Uncharacterized protein n=1 Tax=Ophidiomyces ophidiicola TaxID=1387563 RepID=A0ACB8V3R5_9EURO|nr:uncharacterized protein LOZ57_005292 [Ophidiomyces ophidiicola]KAI1912707.1 hypothetical protein LOZ61_003145 [Ophidiomyces ophidiicola]KAI1918177.1 hypothetical protein LOZ64_002918 [Ophidiomyces ophidiicola]KAI1928200.1 hypothetical protein LOZ60_002514 [Ophidiomyces ophidiicola]KAI1942995.1 hypothetical protein LOZ57_005292 [Ophidiomyces ophidiicola]KAI1954663.1 hypothetical protein LOZ62_000678 [Ophidiomyces ophidiicola]